MPVYTGFDTTTGKELFKTLVDDTFNSTSRDAVLEAKRLYKMLTSEDLFERTVRFANLPRGEAVVEGEEIPIYNPKMGQTKDYNQAQYGLGFRVSWLFKKTNKYGLVKEWTQSVKMNQLELKEVELAKLWNSPTASYTGYDGLHLAEAAHTCLNDAASTYNNLGSVAMSTTGFESASYYYDTLKDDQGATFFVKPDTLYFHPALRFTFQELTKSDLKPLELSNTTNIWKGAYEGFAYHYLTSTTAWGLVAKNHKLFDIRCYSLSEPDIVTADAPDNTRDSNITSMQAFSWGFGDARMVYVGNT
jgi:hypothetical protein